MKAVTVAPGIAGSVRLEELAEPDAALGSVVVEALAGEWDMCSNGGYTERGIKQADGFMAERPDQAQQALQRAPDDIKVVMEFA
jgi:hypothetical protein